jgi:hypothetical protein
MKGLRVKLLSECCEDLISRVESLNTKEVTSSLSVLTSEETNRVVKLHKSLSMSSDQCCSFWQVCDRFRYEDLESSDHILDEVSVVNLLDIWHNELCELRFMLRRRVEFEQEESSSKQTSLVVVSNNSARDNMLASLFKAHELMETRVKPLRVPFGEIHMLERTLQNIAACYDDVACFLRMNEAAEDLSSQDRSAILHSIRETVRVMSVIEPYIPIRIESSFLNVRVVSSHVLDELGDIVFIQHK